LRILHVWNTAGVASIIAKYMDKMFGTESNVIMRRQFDKLGLTTYGELWDSGSKVFTFRALLKARKYDLVHVHDFDKFVSYLKFLYPNKPVILHYHGSMIRGKAKERERYYKKADFLIVSTSDLLGDLPNATHVPNPVDTEFFHPVPIESEPGTALHFNYNSIDLAKVFAETHNLRLTIYTTEKDGWISHVKLPEFLCRFEYYIDVKRNNEGKLLHALSKTGLEALGCGLKVISWDGKIVEVLSKENKPDSVTKQIYKIYKNYTEP